MLANEGNPYDRQREARLRMVEESRRRRAIQGTLWTLGGTLVTFGVAGIAGYYSGIWFVGGYIALLVFGLWGLVTSWLIGARK